MKNRAKCRLCNSIIESFHPTDLVLCKCGEISVDGGDSMKCYAKDWNNFVRVDDEGNEIIPKIIDKIEQEERKEKPTKSEIINMIDEMRAKIESLPPHVMTTPINHYDYYSLLVLMSAALRSD